MSDTGLMAKPPGGLLRWLLRLPIVMYRLKLGSLLGGRFLLINHIGRKSGKTRQAVVEVVKHDKASDTYYVASGWGYESNWYRNLMATPTVIIQVGRRKIEVNAETLSPTQSAEVLIDYRQQHPFSANQLSKMMGIDIGHASSDELIDIVQKSLPIVAFRPI